MHEVQRATAVASVVRVRVRSRSRHTLLKIPRSLYIGNHWSENIHTWTIGTQ